jgi:hypothetical protein
MSLTKPLLLALLVLGVVIVSPASAYYSRMDIEGRYSTDPGVIETTRYDATTSISFTPNGTAVYGINLVQKYGARTDFILYYGEGQSVSGYTEYKYSSIGWSQRVLSINGETVSESFLDVIPSNDEEIISYATNMSDNDQVISSGFLIHHRAVFNPLESYFEVTDFDNNLITGVDITSTDALDVVVLTAPYDIVRKNADATSVGFLGVAGDWMNFAWQTATFMLGFFISVFAWIKFLFVDNLLLIVGLWIGVTMAYSALTSANIFVFYKRFFGYQRALLTFMMEMWNYLIMMAVAVKTIIFKWI